MNQYSDRTQESLDMTRTDEPSAGVVDRAHTSITADPEADYDDAYLLSSPTYFLQYHGNEWNIKPSDTVCLIDQSARNAVVSVKQDKADAESRIFYLTHHPTEFWHVTGVFSPPSECQ